MNFTADPFLRGAPASIPIAYMWNYTGFKVRLYFTDKVKSFVDDVVTRKRNY